MIEGVNTLAKKYTAHSFKMDPDIPLSDGGFSSAIKGMGFSQFSGSIGFETIQPRFNYRIYLNNRDEEQLFADLTQQTRRNVRLAVRHGVEVRICGKST